MLGAVPDVRFGGLELTGRLQGQLNRVLDALYGRLPRPRGHDVDHPQRELRNGRVRLPTERRKTATDRSFDAHRVEPDDSPVALDDGRRQADFLDVHAVEHAHPPLSEPQVQLCSGRESVAAIRGMYGVATRSEHACTYRSILSLARPRTEAFRAGTRNMWDMGTD